MNSSLVIFGANSRLSTLILGDQDFLGRFQNIFLFSRNGFAKDIGVNYVHKKIECRSKLRAEFTKIVMQSTNVTCFLGTSFVKRDAVEDDHLMKDINMSILVQRLTFKFKNKTQLIILGSLEAITLFPIRDDYLKTKIQEFVFFKKLFLRGHRNATYVALPPLDYTRRSWAKVFVKPRTQCASMLKSVLTWDCQFIVCSKTFCLISWITSGKIPRQSW